MNFNIYDWNFEINSMYGLSSCENSSWDWLYANSVSSVTGAIKREVK